ncbi:M1 family aminopeptidase [Hyalangium rubrum]|uniref:M1 family aminopeptidase n=1 Tax=Hyalangium rubrum TaxID=3103134 RepID=A0ABU5GVH9_9BACT|nr:M1 family aminopeptidase [Hyalangium sp. s54d21]MDY7225180.1 M1 family aminopeptidase [Hyalangium sp. s54d21]
MLAIALFELRRRLGMLSTWVYFGVYLALGFITMNAAGGAWEGVVFSAGGGGKVLANSPHSLGMMMAFLGYTGVIITGAMMGQAVYQDFAAGTHTLFFTTPISKAQYLFGRFLGAFLVLLVIFSSLGLGAFVGSHMPWLQKHLVGPTLPAAYLRPYLLSVLPNLIITGSLFFALATLTRRILPVYVASVVLFIGYLVGSNLLAELDTKWIAALVDPFGLSAQGFASEYWTVAEKNTQLLPLEGWFLVNRLVWLAIGMGALAFTYLRFQRTHALDLKGAKEQTPREAETATAVLVPPPATRDFRSTTFLGLLPRLAWLDLKETVKNVYFVVMVLAGVLFVLISSRALGSIYGTNTWPVTYMVLELVGGTFSLFHVIIITFYSGELIWRERDAHMSGLMDTLPTPGWLPYVTKLLALMGVQVLLTFVVLACGMLVQLTRGYTQFELGLYLQELFGMRLLDLWLLCVLAVFIHVVVNHKYLGHFVMVLYLMVSTFAAQLGFEHNLYRFGGTPPYTYSDMNGYGPFLRPFYWFQGYWALTAVVLALVAHLGWVRGTEEGRRSRLLSVRARLSHPVRFGLALSLLALALVGTYIFHNTNRLNRFTTEREEQEELAEYERKYKALEKEPQPRIVAVKVQTDLYPQEARVHFQGTYGLENRSGQPVKAIYVALPATKELTVKRLSVAGMEAPSEQDAKHGLSTYRLSEPLPPGAKAELHFDLEYTSRGFKNDAQNTEVVENGSFLNSNLLPHLGYSEGAELSDEDIRKRMGLPHKERMADVNDLNARMNTYITSDSDWVTFEATVSTSPDQIALAPGYLEREWTEGGRRYFHYKMDRPILNFYSFLSARWQVRRDKWNDVAIEVYYHPGHEYNVERMVDAVKASLDYYTQAFSPYQHRQVRILEFPRYATFAQSFPNTIPYSESIGFIARVDPDDPEDVDYPYYVTAHEVAHQWWAHQVIGGNVQGATLLSETLSQYSALMVMKRKYGAERMGRFLRHELDRYLRSRAIERNKEMPLARVENQAYVHYNKGSLVMYALQDYVGEDKVNQALAAFLKKTAYQQPPFTHSPELIAELRAVTPEHLRYLIEDLFERITLYENRAVTATSTARPDGKFEVKLTAKARKVEANGLGEEKDLSLDDWVDVGVLDKDGKPLYLERHRVQAQDVSFTVVVDQQPFKAGLDPLYKLIDRKPDDNTVRVEAL